jgi:catechol 2,3-dioxygenase-like lactoylglutathione lyase family enzyme
MITAIDHAQITVPKGAEEQAKLFYCEFLGLREVERPPNRKKNGNFWLQLGQSQIHVSIEDGVERAKTKAHLAYRVENLAAWEIRLKERGCEFVESPARPDARSIIFRDPFGNRTELIEYVLKITSL